jgi:hypothetical protein
MAFPFESSPEESGTHSEFIVPSLILKEVDAVIARTLSSTTIAASLAAALLAPTFAAPTPVPGGANQAAGVTGSLHSTLFNGQVRVRKMQITKLTQTGDEVYGEIPGQRWIVFRALMSNGTSRPSDFQQFSASIADADCVSVDAQPDKVRPMGAVTNIAPGGAWRENILFPIPADFKPVKIVLVSADKHYKAFRISVAPSDVPAP